MTPINPGCRNEEIIAYLDGELDASANMRLEQHAKDCSHCCAALREQRLLFHEVNSALTDPSAIEMPENFAKLLAVRAQSDMSGVCDQRERRRALCLCAILAAASFALLGGSALKQSVLAPLNAIWKVGAAILGFLSQALYDAGASIAVVARGLAGTVLFESRSSALLVLILFALALLAFARMIVGYHRGTDGRVNL